jgi:hypothetical protein
MAVIRLHVEHDFQTAVLTEKPFTLKDQYAPTKLIDARARLGDDFELQEHPEGDVVVPLPRVVSHRLRHHAGTNAALQELMNRRAGGYSRNERYTVQKALVAGDDAQAKSGGRLTVWTPGRDIHEALPTELQKHGVLRALLLCFVLFTDALL